MQPLGRTDIEYAPGSTRSSDKSFICLLDFRLMTQNGQSIVPIEPYGVRMQRHSDLPSTEPDYPLTRLHGRITVPKQLRESRVENALFPV